MSNEIAAFVADQLGYTPRSMPLFEAALTITSAWSSLATACSEW